MYLARVERKGVIINGEEQPWCSIVSVTDEQYAHWGPANIGALCFIEDMGPDGIDITDGARNEAREKGISLRAVPPKNNRITVAEVRRALRGG